MSSYALVDSTTMVRRNLLHLKRYPAMVFYMIVMPSIFLLIFRFVFGGALEKSSGGHYIDYLAPGMLLMVPATIASSVAVSIAMDTTTGIVNRFRTMAISPGSFLTGHVVGALIQGMLSVVFMIGVALLVGWRPHANPLEWVAALGLIAFTLLAIIWFSVALGLLAPTPETASNTPMPIMLLPFFGSGLVATDTMPAGLRQFAEYQPFTPLTETMRGLLMGTEIGNNGILALAWCTGITAVGYLWSKSVYRKQTR
ncbi:MULTISPECIES: ABC transporter permease [unclassified Nocardia]|uniref:ABC transporter permease n=1 Tax=unclassified Nocardia TaxID=2637762 RepID=UPI001CE430C3|nr:MULTISPECIES: ABC transporter permease [unclassified Nocardia]